MQLTGYDTYGLYNTWGGYGGTFVCFVPSERYECTCSVPVRKIRKSAVPYLWGRGSDLPFIYIKGKPIPFGWYGLPNKYIKGGRARRSIQATMFDSEHAFALPCERYVGATAGLGDKARMRKTNQTNRTAVA